MDLSIIIVNWNTREITLNCLRSVYESLGGSGWKEKTLDPLARSLPANGQVEMTGRGMGTNSEVIVVDNGSTDGSVEAIKKEFPQAKLIENQENLGFAKANNQGMETANGRYVLLLNSDTIVLNDALQKMVAWMDEHKDVGAASCQLLNDNKTIQPTGGYFPTLGKLFAWMFFLDDLPVSRNLIGPYHFRNQNVPVSYSHPESERSESEESLANARKTPLKQVERFLAPLGMTRIYGANIFSQEHEQDWVTGAFMMVRKEVIDKVDKLDDKYFMYFEEVEWCYRIKRAGWKVAFTPSARVIHLGQKSSLGSSVGSPTGLIGEYRGIKEFYRKYFPAQVLLARFALKLGALLRIILWGIIKGRKDAIKIYEKAFRLA